MYFHIISFFLAGVLSSHGHHHSFSVVSLHLFPIGWPEIPVIWKKKRKNIITKFGPFSQYIQLDLNKTVSVIGTPFIPVFSEVYRHGFAVFKTTQSLVFVSSLNKFQQIRNCFEYFTCSHDFFPSENHLQVFWSFHDYFLSVRNYHFLRGRGVIHKPSGCKLTRTTLTNSIKVIFGNKFNYFIEWI